MAQIAKGDLWSVYVDDTGPGGNSASSETLPPDRKSYVAAVFPAHSGMVLNSRLGRMLAELEQTVGVHEFHFVDIYGGKGRYRSVAISDRLAYFDAFAALVEELQVTFIVQSLGVDDARKWFEALQIRYEPLRKVFDLTQPGDLSLFLLLLQIQDYLRLQMPSASRAAVFVDEGWKRTGTGVWFGPFEERFLDGLVLSASSKDVPGLQFADFGAFVLNRSQLILGKSPLSKLDMRILHIWRRVGTRFINVEPRRFKVQEAEGGGLHLVLASEKGE